MSGTKYWIMFPPNSPPPGVITDGALEGQVTAPVSVAEWFLSGFYEQAKLQPQFHHAVCSPGQMMYVPAGWWHLVINLSDCIAMTGNFVPPPKLPFVLDFLKNKPEQISGFKDDNIACEDIFGLFVELIRKKDETALNTALDGMRNIERARDGKGKWQSLVNSTENNSFSFGFEEDE